MIADRKIAIVTGGSGNIGQSIATALSNEGYRTAIFDRSPPSEQFGSLPKEVIFLSGDVCREEQVKRAFAELFEKEGRLDLLVNAAGISPKRDGSKRARIWEVSFEEWQNVIGVNLNGVFVTCKVATEYFLRQRSGNIVNIGSVMGFIGSTSASSNRFPYSNSGAHYCASKAAVHNLTKSLARELAEFNVRVNCIAPGAVEGGMLLLDEDQRQSVLRQLPLNSFCKARDIAEAVLFLACSDKSRAITGHTITVDGGWNMR
ncbi:SDR family NAD(P)-dependent oxidoreductase [Bradyrhizobium cenepequi]|uniref:SDR family NAD(P)-dependent oxidoreductase n=1 Tax=Bradyrhizobium cenepequi TaxID=2821403 RepID=UPI001CE2F452|nr:SDR family oxidoreductase [Bradyrhizobium cenepequi]MCA6111546.1 SDR family oxidoreductase [Bradyrhizobium cenepequi]